MGEACRPPATQDIERFRVRQNPFKKLSDEVVPVMAYLRQIGFQGSLRFPFDNSTPDCWIRTSDGDERGIEVTVAKARERVLLAKELNETGSGRGYLGLPDDLHKKYLRRSSLEDARCLRPTLHSAASARLSNHA